MFMMWSTFLLWSSAAAVRLSRGSQLQRRLFVQSASAAVVLPAWRAAAATPALDRYAVVVQTDRAVDTMSTFVVEVDPALAPLGAARFKELVELKFFDDSRFHRASPPAAADTRGLFLSLFFLGGGRFTTAM